MIKKTKKQEVIKAFGKSTKDAGSTEVQIAILTARIKDLAEHFKKNKKDYHSRLGLLKMVGKRRSHLKYLKRTSIDSYRTIISKLKIRG